MKMIRAKSGIRILVAVILAAGCESGSRVGLPDAGGDADGVGGELGPGDGGGMGDNPFVGPGEVADQGDVAGEDSMDVGTSDLLPDSLVGSFGKPCQDNSDCPSGFCLAVSEDESVCTITCAEECPSNWVCKGMETPPDWTFICVPPAGNLCKECHSDVDCKYKGDMCIAVGITGTYCAMDCSQGKPCLAHYSCAEVVGLDGGTGMQCVPDTGSCICTWELNGKVEACSVSNEFGKCYGDRVCDGPGGWTECSAEVPAAEECNGHDDNCDGETDEGFPDLNQNGIADCAELDDDSDGVVDGKDNCPQDANPGQENTDDDAQGDICDDDDDNDGMNDSKDNCPLMSNPGQEDLDSDGLGDVCDPDIDGDGFLNAADCAPYDPQAYPGAPETCSGKDENCNGQVDEGFPDFDNDKMADCVDEDDDGDLDPDVSDCAPLDPLFHAGAVEVCNGLDDNCNGKGDDGCPPVKFTLRQVESFMSASTGTMQVRLIVGRPTTGTVVSEEEGIVLRWGPR